MINGEWKRKNRELFESENKMVIVFGERYDIKWDDNLGSWRIFFSKDTLLSDKGFLALCKFASNYWLSNTTCRLISLIWF